MQRSENIGNTVGQPQFPENCKPIGCIRTHQIFRKGFHFRQAPECVDAHGCGTKDHDNDTLCHHAAECHVIAHISCPVDDDRRKGYHRHCVETGHNGQTAGAPVGKSGCDQCDQIPQQRAGGKPDHNNDHGGLQILRNSAPVFLNDRQDSRGNGQNKGVYMQQPVQKLGLPRCDQQNGKQQRISNCCDGIPPFPIFTFSCHAVFLLSDGFRCGDKDTPYFPASP